MKIVLVVAGAGSMYCGACTRDATLARAFAALGHKAIVLPVYTPLRLEEDLAAPSMPLHLGGIGAFLREQFRWYESLPKALRNGLDSPRLIAWASQFAVRTQAKDLGSMTVSVLQGVDGKHRTEMERTAQDVTAESPDLVILPNTLLSGLAKPLKETGKKVLCQVQGEDGFLNELPTTFRDGALAQIRQNLVYVDGFLSPSQSHVDAMAKLLDIEPKRFQIVRHAMTLPESLPSLPKHELVIGCLSSIRRAKGQDVLLKAFRQVWNVHVLVAGRTLEPIYEKELRTMADTNVEFLGELTPSQKSHFFAECDAICLPSRLVESRGIVALEALANGKPVFAPDHGVFRELATPAVILHKPEDPTDLAKSFQRHTRDELLELGAIAREYIAEHHSMKCQMADLSDAIRTG